LEAFNVQGDGSLCDISYSSFINEVLQMWNKEAAVNFVRNNAHAHATGYCDRAVTAAIEHGVYPGPGYRKNQPSYKLYRHN